MLSGSFGWTGEARASVIQRELWRVSLRLPTRRLCQRGVFRHHEPVGSRPISTRGFLADWQTVSPSVAPDKEPPHPRIHVCTSRFAVGQEWRALPRPPITYTPSLCSLCCGAFAVQPLLCSLCCAAFAVQPLLCSLCCAAFAVQPLLCSLRCAAFAVQPSLCSLKGRGERCMSSCHLPLGTASGLRKVPCMLIFGHPERSHLCKMRYGEVSRIRPPYVLPDDR
jgi:hypothetical protein